MAWLWLWVLTTGASPPPPPPGAPLASPPAPPRRLPCLLLGLRLALCDWLSPACIKRDSHSYRNKPASLLGWLVSSSSFPFLLIYGLTLVICLSMASARIVCICSGEPPRHSATTISSASKNSVLYSSECLCVGIIFWVVRTVRILQTPPR